MFKKYMYHFCNFVARTCCLSPFGVWNSLFRVFSFELSRYWEWFIRFANLILRVIIWLDSRKKKSN